MKCGEPIPLCRKLILSILKVFFSFLADFIIQVPVVDTLPGGQDLLILFLIRKLSPAISDHVAHTLSLLLNLFYQFIDVLFIVVVFPTVLGLFIYLLFIITLFLVKFPAEKLLKKLLIVLLPSFQRVFLLLHLIFH